MEAGQQSPKYLTTMTFAHEEAMDIDGARMEAEKVLDCARGTGLKVVKGHTGLVMEDNAIESFNWGSEDVLRNRKAERGELLTSKA